MLPSQHLPELPRCGAGFALWLQEGVGSITRAPTSVSPGLCVELQGVRLRLQGRVAESEGTARAGLAALCLLFHPGCCPGELSLAL